MESPRKALPSSDQSPSPTGSRVLHSPCQLSPGPRTGDGGSGRKQHKGCPRGRGRRAGGSRGLQGRGRPGSHRGKSSLHCLGDSLTRGRRQFPCSCSRGSPATRPGDGCGHGARPWPPCTVTAATTAEPALPLPDRQQETPLPWRFLGAGGLVQVTRKPMTSEACLVAPCLSPLQGRGWGWGWGGMAGSGQRAPGHRGEAAASVPSGCGLSHPPWTWGEGTGLSSLQVGARG